jgi:hypothetical protein
LWQLSGVPTQAGTYKFELTAKDHTGNKVSETYVMAVYGSTETGSMFPVPLNQKFKIVVGQTAYVPDYRNAKVKLTGIEAVACLQFYGGDCKPFVKLSVSIPNGDAGDLTIVSGGSQTFGGLTIYAGEVSLGSNVAVLSLSALDTGVHIPRYEASPTGELVRGREYMFTGFVWEAPPNTPVYFFLRRPDGTLIREGKPSEATTNADGSARRSLPIRIPDNAPAGTYTSWVMVGDVASNKAVHNVVDGGQVPGVISAYLNQRFELRPRQIGIVRDFKQLRIIAGDIPSRGCPGVLGSTCGLTVDLYVEDPTTGASTSFYLVKGGFKEIFGATITLADLNSSTGVATLLVTAHSSEPAPAPGVINVTLNHRFELPPGYAAIVTDYKQMRVEHSSVATLECKVDLYGGCEKKASLHARLPSGETQAVSLYRGESKTVLGVTFSLVELAANGTATLVITP